MTAQHAPASAPFDDPRDAPRSDDPALLARIRERFEAARYTVDGVEAILGAEAAQALHRDLFVPAVARLAELVEADDVHPDRPDGDGAGGAVGSATGADAAARRELAALIELFLLARPVDPTCLPGLDDLASARLATCGPDGRALALVDVRPYEADGATWWIVSDLGGAQLAERAAAGIGREGTLRRDHVVGIGPATTMLAQLTPRDPVARAFDLGVGMGIQTMHLLAHAAHVTASDISERALAVARCNLVLNAPALGLDPERVEDRVSLRLGSMLEPVAGARFELIVSNPPFVITPRSAGEQAADRFTYRDGGQEGDAIMRELLGGLDGVLAPGGRAVMLGNWEVHDGDGPWTRLGAWAGELDAWVIERERATPVEYADMWLRDAGENAELDAWRERFLDYLRDFAARGVASVGMGILLLRRRDPELPVAGEAAPLRAFEAIGHALGMPLGEAIGSAWDRLDWLRSLEGDALFDETLVVAGDVTEERHSRPGDEGPSAILLRQGGAFRRTYPLSSELAGFVGVCDGELAAGQITAALAGIVGVEEAAIRRDLEPALRDLVHLGFLEPAWM